MSFLERGYRMRAAQKEARERETIRHPISDEEMELGDNDRSLKEIFRNKKSHDLFLNKYLFDVDPDAAKEIADSLSQNIELDPDQMKFMEDAREGFNLRSAQVEKIKESFSTTEMSRIADLIPVIKQVVGRNSIDEITEFFKGEFEELAFSDQATFNKIMQSLSTLHDIRSGEEAKNLEEEITHVLGVYGLSEKEYAEATKDGLTPETRDSLEELAAGKFSTFQKVFDKITRGRLRRAAGEELYLNYAEQERLLKECDSQLRSVGIVLAGTLTPEVMLQMQQAMLAGTAFKEKKQEYTVKTMDDYKKVKEDLNSTQARFEEYVATEAVKRNRKPGDKAFRDDMKKVFAQNEYQKQKSYTAVGTLAALIAFLFGSRSKDEIEASLT